MTDFATLVNEEAARAAVAAAGLDDGVTVTRPDRAPALWSSYSVTVTPYAAAAAVRSVGAFGVCDPQEQHVPLPVSYRELPEDRYRQRVTELLIPVVRAHRERLQRLEAADSSDLAESAAAALTRRRDGGGHDVVLDATGPDRSAVIRALREATAGLGPREGKHLAVHAPLVVLLDRPLRAAHALVSALRLQQAVAHVQITGRPEARVTDGGVVLTTCAGCGHDTTQLAVGCCSDCQLDRALPGSTSAAPAPEVLP